MTKISYVDLDQRLDILELIYGDVVELRNKELSDRLVRYRSDNIQWVLNMLEENFKQLRDALEMEEVNHIES
jgi:hypothetical protein